MNGELSVWELVLQAGVTVQAVMLILLTASVVSWFMIIQRWMYFRAARQAAEAFEEQFWSGVDLGMLYREGSAKAEQGAEFFGMESVFRAGFKEFSRLRQQRGTSAEAIMEGVERAMRVALSREDEDMGRHLAFLATVGSTSPYVGLFGTVWGIMGAFQGLASVKQATLATVAPGISEALIATAMGLFAAIPAVIAYNRFSAWMDQLANKYDMFAEEFSSILHRQAYVDDQRQSDQEK